MNKLKKIVTALKKTFLSDGLIRRKKIAFTKQRRHLRGDNNFL